MFDSFLTLAVLKYYISLDTYIKIFYHIYFYQVVLLSMKNLSPASLYSTLFTGAASLSEDLRLLSAWLLTIA